ncbi:MAG: TIR domain-containing protein [bacterium]|nr:TIR domain-containing protein [bacterium]
MPNLKSRNLFISHAWTYGDAYDNLVTLLNAAPNFLYKNYSIPKDDPVHNAANDAELYRAIQNQIVFCDVILILAGKYATYRKWIQKEIEIAKSYVKPKPIVAIRPRGNQQISSVVSEAADRLVNWNTDSIVSAIRELDR